MTVAGTLHGLSADAGATITRQFETICRALLRGQDTQQFPDLLLYITHEPHPFGNFAVVSGPHNHDQIKRAIGPLLNVPQPSAVVLSAPPVKAHEEFLRDHGFALAEAMPAMAVDIDSMQAQTLRAGFTFAEYSRNDDDAEWCEAFAAGYGIPLRVARDFGPRAAEKYLNRGELHFYSIATQDKIATTSVLYLEGGLAGIYCVSTLPEHRGKGLAAYATAEALHCARALGYRTGILQSSAMAESIYRRLGFQQFGSMPLYVRTPGGATAGH